MKKITFEVCAGSYEDCIAAQNGGADRIELNSALYLGGLTPSFGTVALVKKDVTIPIAAMVRPRAGGFCYNLKEYDVMKEDAKSLLAQGVEGIVFGFLHENYTIDKERTKEFTQLVHDLNGEAIVHRAFDLVNDVDAAIQALIECGVDRVLTSGLAPSATQGVEVLKHLQETYGKQIEILAGVGLRSDNVKGVIEATAVKQVHSSCKGWKKDVTAINGDINYGYDVSNPDGTEYVVEKLVKEFREATE